MFKLNSVPLDKIQRRLNRVPPAEIKSLINRGAIFYVNHSGGKILKRCFTIFIATYRHRRSLLSMHCYQALNGKVWKLMYTTPH